MPGVGIRGGEQHDRFSTLQCGSWIDAEKIPGGYIECDSVSVPFNAGRGLMPPYPVEDPNPTWTFQYPSMRVVD